MESILPLLNIEFLNLENPRSKDLVNFLQVVSHGKFLKSSSVKEVVSFTNTCLNSSKNRLEGLTTLHCIIEQCETSVFTEHAKTWLKLLLQALKGHDTSTNTIYTCTVLGELLAYISVFPELRREVASDYIQDVCQTLLQQKSQDVGCRQACLECLNTTIKYFPGPCGNVKKAIDSAVIPVLETSANEALVKVCSRLYAASSHTGGGGTGGKNHREQWATRLDRVCGTMHHIINRLIDQVGVGDGDVIEDNVFQTTFTVSDVCDVFVYQQQITTMTLVFTDLCSLEMSVPVKIPIGSILHLVAKCLTITQKALLSRATKERCLLSSVLPIMHQDMFTIIDTLITSLGGHMIPYCHMINKLVVKGLSLYSAHAKVYGSAQSYGTVKGTIYKVILKWLKVTGSCNDLDLVADDLVDYVISDATPAVDSLKLESGPSARKDQHGSSHGKGKKKRTVNYEPIASHRKSDNMADHDLVATALEVLCELVMHHGCFLKPEHYKSIQELAIPLLLRIHQSTTATPIPYTDARCRLQLYHVLITCVTSPHPSWPPPVSCVIRLLQFGTRDDSLEVSSFCRQAVAICEVLIHPRAVTLNNPITVSNADTRSNTGGGYFRNTTQHEESDDDTLGGTDVSRRVNGRHGHVMDIDDITPVTMESRTAQVQTQSTVSEPKGGDVSIVNNDEPVLENGDSLANSKDVESGASSSAVGREGGSSEMSESSGLHVPSTMQDIGQASEEMAGNDPQTTVDLEQRHTDETDKTGTVDSADGAPGVDSENVDETERVGVKRKLEDDTEESQTKIVKESEGEDADEVNEMLGAFVDDGPDSE